MDEKRFTEIQNKLNDILSIEDIHSFEYPQLLLNDSEKNKKLFCNGYIGALSSLYYLDAKNDESIYHFMISEFFSINKGLSNRHIQSGMHYCRTINLDVYHALYTHYYVMKETNKYENTDNN